MILNGNHFKGMIYKRAFSTAKTPCVYQNERGINLHMPKNRPSEVSGTTRCYTAT